MFVFALQHCSRWLRTLLWWEKVQSVPTLEWMAALHTDALSFKGDNTMTSYCFNYIVVLKCSRSHLHRLTYFKYCLDTAIFIMVTTTLLCACVGIFMYVLLFRLWSAVRFCRSRSVFHYFQPSNIKMSCTRTSPSAVFMALLGKKQTYILSAA